VNRWEALFREPEGGSSLPAFGAVNAGKVMVITGAGGCIGSALAETIAAGGARLIILLDHSEENLYQIRTRLDSLGGKAPHVAVLGDVCDTKLLEEIFETHRPDVVYHAAAYKHVALMEENAIAAVRNNALGTRTLAECAVKFRTKQLIMISTDKAVNPRSVMGASKRIAELILLQQNSENTRMSVVRFGNVFGSNGSVVPRFRQQIAGGGPVTVTDREATRYFLTRGEAVEIILRAAALGEGGNIFVPKLGAPLKIVELAERMIAAAGDSPRRPVVISYIGLRSGEKLHELLISENETVEPTRDEILERVRTNAMPAQKLEAGLRQMEDSVKERNVILLVGALRGLIPEYEPSEKILDSVKAPA
jgi:FlaA1/EpsC-like NDP-sugar epimerase